MPGVLADRVAIVTGAGRGIGREIARGLASAGAAVAVTGRRLESLEDAVLEIERMGGRAISVIVDVTDKPAIDRAVCETERQLGPIDILVSNAGVEGPVGRVWEVSQEEWRRSVEVNVVGPFNIAHAVLPGMVARNRGRIINVGSTCGLFGVPYDTGYSASKAALIRFTEGLAMECAPHGVCAWVIHPGAVHTAMSDAVMNSPGGRKWFGKYREVLERGKTPIEWASELCVFLASGAADALTGRFISVRDSYRDMAARANDICSGDMHTLRLKLTPSPAPEPLFW